MISSYVNCELIDQEFIIDTFYTENLIHKINNYEHKHKAYNRQSTLILFNKLIDQIATDFFCLKLDKKTADLLPDKYALRFVISIICFFATILFFSFRKFTNALDILVNSLENPINNDKTPNISPINLPSINGFGSFKESTINPPIETSTTKSNTIITYETSCSTDADCDTMTCQSGHCRCPKPFFWSSISHRCIKCDDILIDNRCFRLSTHKSTWFEANDYCHDEEAEDYTMKLASNLNQTDIQYLKENFLHNNDDEHIDYMYWIGATSHFDTRKLHGFNTRIKRQIPTRIFRWYDNGETAQLYLHDLWCSQMDYMSLTTINNNQLCVSITSCGLYADDCQRNYRFLCQAV